MTRELLSSLEKKVNPQHAALVVIDIQNDYCANGGAFDKVGSDVSFVQKMVPQLVKFIDQMRERGFFVIFTRSHYNSENNLYLSDPWLEQAARRRGGLYTKVPNCVPGTWGAEFYMVKPRPGEAIVTKHTFDAFENTDLDHILRARGIRTLVMTGYATNVCVETTARHGYVKNYYIVVARDMVSATHPEFQEVNLRNMELHFGEVVGSEQILRAVDSNMKTATVG